MKDNSLIEDVQKNEILIDTLSDQLIEEDSPFVINKEIMTKEEMKNNCATLREKINKLEGMNKNNQLYSNLENEIIKGIVKLEFNVNYYIKNGNLYNLFKERLAEIIKIANSLNENDEDQLKLLMIRYDNNLMYASSADINIDVIKEKTEEAIGRSFIKNNIK